METITSIEKTHLSNLIKTSANPKLLRELIIKIAKEPNVLLKKYMEHMCYCEGCMYLYDDNIRNSSVKFTDNEIKVLKLIEEKIENE